MLCTDCSTWNLFSIPGQLEFASQFVSFWIGLLVEQTLTDLLDNFLDHSDTPMEETQTMRPKRYDSCAWILGEDVLRDSCQSCSFLTGIVSCVGIKV